jgi:hypothetical protein
VHRGVETGGSGADPLAATSASRLIACPLSLLISCPYRNQREWDETPAIATMNQNNRALSTRWVEDAATLSADMAPPSTALGQARLRTWGEARLALLHERGISLAIVARDLGKDLSGVSRVNRGQRRSVAIEREIARRLGLSVAHAFPEWHRRQRRRDHPARIQP